MSRIYVLAMVMLPPPKHGASSINVSFIDALKNAGARVDVVNLVPSRLSFLFDGVLWKIARLFYMILVIPQVIFSLLKRPKSIYFGVSGGFGLIYDIALSCLIRFSSARIYIHHHSFAYIHEKNFLMSIFLHILRRTSITHIFLCEEMAKAMASTYGADVIGRSKIVSNAAFFDEKPRDFTKKKQEFFTLGFISNITLDKGIREFVDTFREVSASYPGARAVVAGPCMDEGVDKFLQESLSQLPLLKYKGAVFGSKKEDFFKEIDLLLFPTKYKNEAEPLVIYEAAAHGVPCIANGRGCISSMVDKCCGDSVSATHKFNEAVIDFLKMYEGSDQVLISEKVRVGFMSLRADSQLALKNILTDILGLS